MRGLRIFFATDIHGSDLCFRKFVRAPNYYGADLAILGGDLSGKVLIPIYSLPNGRFMAKTTHGPIDLLTESEVKEFEKHLADQGKYTVRNPPTREGMGKPYSQVNEEAFRDVIIDRLTRWIDLAKKESRHSGVRFLWIPGNDDPLFVDELLNDSEEIINIDEQIFQIDPYMYVSGLGGSNPTPWNTPREFEESDIRRRLIRLVKMTPDIFQTIYVIHVPPYDSGLDEAPVLDKSFRIRYSPGGALTVPVGSRAVRNWIEQFQPPLVLSGHIHESRGHTRIGSTVCINPGSQYNTGMLSGALISFVKGRLNQFQLTEG